jgi:hypothetical protein
MGSYGGKRLVLASAVISADQITLLFGGQRNITAPEGSRSFSPSLLNNLGVGARSLSAIRDCPRRESS